MSFSNVSSSPSREQINEAWQEVEERYVNTIRAGITIQLQLNQRDF